MTYSIKSVWEDGYTFGYGSNPPENSVLFFFLHKRHRFIDAHISNSIFELNIFFFYLNQNHLENNGTEFFILGLPRGSKEKSSFFFMFLYYYY